MTSPLEKESPLSSSRLVRSSGRPISARETSSALESSPLADRAVLNAVEALGEATGALCFRTGSRDLGAILVERGRVCWAISAATRMRLSDILRFQASPPLSPEVIEAVFQTCRAHGKPLGEYLVQQGLLTASAFRASLRQHTAEAIVEIARTSTNHYWKPHRRATYDPAFTFAPAEVWACIGMLQRLEEGTLARAALARVLLEEATGLAFCRSDSPLLIGYYGPTDLTLDEVDLAGRWVLAGLDVARAVEKNAQVLAGACASGASALAWSQGKICYFVTAQERSTFARILSSVTRGA